MCGVFISFVCLGLFCFMELGVEPRAIHITNKHPTELYSQPLWLLLTPQILKGLKVKITQV